MHATVTVAEAVASDAAPVGLVPVTVTVSVVVTVTLVVQWNVQVSSRSRRPFAVVSPPTKVTGTQAESAMLTPMSATLPPFVTANVYVTEPPPAGRVAGLAGLATSIFGPLTRGCAGAGWAPTTDREAETPTSRSTALASA